MSSKQATSEKKVSTKAVSKPQESKPAAAKKTKNASTPAKKTPGPQKVSSSAKKSAEKPTTKTAASKKPTKTEKSEKPEKSEKSEKSDKVEKKSAPAKKAVTKKSTAKTTKKVVSASKKGGAVTNKETKSESKSENKAENSLDKSNTRYFKAIVEGGEAHGRFSGAKPKQAANKALTSILKSKEQTGGNVNGEIKFTIVECTRGSKHKQYHYIGKREKLTTPMKVKIGSGANAKEIEYKFNNRVMKDKSVVVKA